MPTGYTSIIEEGNPTFRDFALRCARGMGATIMQRDEPSANPPRIQGPSTYHAEAAQKAKTRLDELRLMSPSACAIAARREHAEAMVAWKERVDNDAALRAKYDAMVREVNAWKAPTPAHEGLRAFMLDQINVSTRYRGGYDPPKMLTGETWLAREVDYATGAYALHIEEQRLEEARTAERNAWIAALLGSLPST